MILKNEFNKRKEERIKLLNSIVEPIPEIKGEGND